jgi:hypothetical protein
MNKINKGLKNNEIINVSIMKNNNNNNSNNNNNNNNNNR